MHYFHFWLVNSLVIVNDNDRVTNYYLRLNYWSRKLFNCFQLSSTVHTIHCSVQNKCSPELFWNVKFSRSTIDFSLSSAQYWKSTLQNRWFEKSTSKIQILGAIDLSSISNIENHQAGVKLKNVILVILRSSNIIFFTITWNSELVC